MNSAIYRILDANLDRCREALRVIEEWCRFGRNNSSEVAVLKNLRHTLAQWHLPEFKQARNTPEDVGTALTHAQELQRADLRSLLLANFSRVQEGLRVLEEYAKLHNLEMAQAMKQMRYQVYSLETAVLFDHSDRRQRLQRAVLYLVTSPVPNFFAQVEASLRGGVDIVQYRDKETADGDRLRIATKLKDLCAEYNALFLVNDRVDVALAVGADGVHLGQTDLPVAIARQLLGAEAIIGQSTTNPEELSRAMASAVDYVGVGPVFATPTKPNKAPAGFGYVQYASHNANLPWFAIGGIDIDNLDGVIKAGAKRIAVVRSLMQSNDPEVVARAMKQKLLSQETV